MYTVTRIPGKLATNIVLPAENAHHEQLKGFTHIPAIDPDTARQLVVGIYKAYNDNQPAPTLSRQS